VTVGREPGESVVIASVPNLRELGAGPIRDGVNVCWGLLYRSTELAGADMTTFAALGLRSAYVLAG
jgi:protein-tyrosine phosphatase